MYYGPMLWQSSHLEQISANVFGQTCALSLSHLYYAL